MDRAEQINKIKSKSAELDQQYNALKEKMNHSQTAEPDPSVEELKSDLEKIKKEWVETIEELKEKSAEYDRLLVDLRMAGKIMSSMGFKIPWHEKIKQKLKKDK